jgi:hypothetical protein
MKTDSAAAGSLTELFWMTPRRDRTPKIRTDPPESLSEMLERLLQADQGADKVALDAMLAVTGRRAFGPVLMIPGLVALSPLSGIPGMPTTMALLVILVCAQLLLRRDHFWLPRFILERRISRTGLHRAVRFLRPIARFVDDLTRPRLRALTDGEALYVVALVAMIIAVTIPPLELVPFAATIAGAALTAFGLSLIVHDGLIALLALLLYTACLTLVGVALLNPG